MKLTNEHKKEIRKIYETPKIEMGRLFRFAPSGHPWFDITKPYYRHFKRRFQQLGGWTPALSKEIGWE